MIEYKDKIINSRCKCDKNLLVKNCKLIMIMPCEHIMHYECFNKKLIYCPICDEEIEKYYSDKEIKNNSNKSEEDYQRFVDIVSVCYFENYSKVNKTLFYKNIVGFPEIIYKLSTYRGFEKGKEISELLLKLANVKLKIWGMNNITNNRKIIISNHSTYFDFVVMFYLFNCGFVSSSSIHNTIAGRQLVNLIPLVLVNRNKDKNTVDKIKEYVSNVGSVCLFPEGMITHPDTLSRFRTGAFYADHPVAPVVLKYNPIVYSDNPIEFLQKMSSSSMEITVYILPEELPPFNKEKIEEVRTKMAKVGNLALSRVSNRDLKEEDIQ